jgi:uncharacterized iron-regulated protein
MSLLEGDESMGRFIVVLLCLLLAACSLSTKVPTKQAGETKMLFTQHVLVGKIWDVNAASFVSKESVAEHIAKSNYILLGETHDNPLHHQGQAWVIAQIAAAKRTAVVAFEMISQQQGQVIAGKNYADAEALIGGLNHIKSNWGYQRFYRDIFAEALRAGFTILPANFDRQKIMAVARKGEGELSARIKTMLDDHPLSEEQAAASRKEIEGSHCGMINEQMTVAMMLVQRAKDAQMAQALMVDDAIDSRVLVAGSGHVRNDRGVPFYLPANVKQNKVLTIAWAEVQPEMKDANEYAKHWGAKQLPFDYVWFTPHVDRPDPCEGFRRHMKNKN